MKIINQQFSDWNFEFGFLRHLVRLNLFKWELYHQVSVQKLILYPYFKIYDCASLPILTLSQSQNT